MNRKMMVVFLMLIALLSMTLAGCGTEKSAEATERPGPDTRPLGLSTWSMNATAWSSPNGATVNIYATPNSYAEGQSAVFSVRLEGDEIASVPCEWDGSAYTASAELNAADGYCYYMILAAADGTSTEVSVNVPNAPTDESLINMESSLDAYCHVTINNSAPEDGKLVITEGTVGVQLPRITLDTGKISCSQANLILSYNGEDVALETLTIPAADASGLCTLDIAGTAFSVPSDMEDDHQLSMRLDVTLSNGQSLTTAGGNWYYLDGELLLAVG